MKVFSIDIETTGLDSNKHQIIEIAAVAFTLGHPLEPISIFHRYAIPEDFVWSIFCLSLHKDVINKLITKQIPDDKQCNIYTDFMIPKQVPYNKLFQELKVWHALTQPEKMIPAGKNFGSFDLQFIKNLPNYQESFKHRSLDPVLAYTEYKDKEPPNLQTCKDRAVAHGAKFNKQEVTHTAIDDCMDVMELVQIAFSMRGWINDKSKG